jgi:hypothetical protein
MPSAVPCLDESINCSGEGGIAKNAGMINRIDSVQAARLHKPAALARVFAAGRPSSGRDAENSWGGDDSKRDESHLSTHGGFLPLPDATRCECRAPPAPGKGRGNSAPLHGGQALPSLSLTPIRPHVRAYHAALGAHCLPAQMQEHGVIRPAVSVDNCAMMAKPGGAVDQQVPDPMRANMTHRHRRPLVLLPSSFRRWVVVGIAGTHTLYIGWERLQNKSHGYHTGPNRHFAFRSRHETSRNVSLGCGKPNKHGLFSQTKKCGRLRGESRPRADPVGDGEGDVTGDA